MDRFFKFDALFSSKFSSKRVNDKTGSIGLFGLVLIAATVAYILVFVQVGFPLLEALEYAWINIIAAVLPGAIAWAITHRIRLTALPFQAFVHIFLSIGFSWAWYLMSCLFGAILDVFRGLGWEVSWLPDNALAWQLAQGLSVYAAVVAAAYAADRTHHPKAPVPAPSEPINSKPRVTRYLAKVADGFAPFDVSEIVIVEGADDYSQVTVIGGQQRLVRLSLKAFEEELGSAQFVRVHRSMLLALDQLVSAEPDGTGRLLVQLSTGRSVRTSREGARLLRARII